MSSDLTNVQRAEIRELAGRITVELAQRAPEVLKAIAEGATPNVRMSDASGWRAARVRVTEVRAGGVSSGDYAIESGYRRSHWGHEVSLGNSNTPSALVASRRVEAAEIIRDVLIEDAVQRVADLVAGAQKTLDRAREKYTTATAKNEVALDYLARMESVGLTMTSVPLPEEARGGPYYQSRAFPQGIVRDAIASLSKFREEVEESAEKVRLAEDRLRVLTEAQEAGAEERASMPTEPVTLMVERSVADEHGFQGADFVALDAATGLLLAGGDSEDAVMQAGKLQARELDLSGPVIWAAVRD